MYPMLESVRFYWCLGLCSFILGPLVDSSSWPLRSLTFYPNAEGVTAEMELRGDGHSPGNTEIKCGSNLSWTPTAELNLTGEVVHVNATGLLSEGSHVICLMNNVPFLNLSVPCLYRDGVPKPLITGLRAVTNGENTCLSIEWELSANSSQVDTWEIYCVDKLANTSVILNSTAVYNAELCYQPHSEWAYCCVGVNLRLNSSSFRACDCQHITIAQPPQPQLNVLGITAQRINNSICIEFDWEFAGHQAINSGVCCMPNHLAFYETCHKKDVPCYMKRFTLSWCGTYGPGNYFLYCYAFNEFNTNDRTGIVKSRIYSSPIDVPKLQEINFSFHSQKSQRCFVVHYTIPKSFYRLQELSLCCGTNHCDNQTTETVASFNSWDSLGMNITHCESANVSDISMDCELKNIFYPNMIVSNNVSITEPVKVLVEGFLLADRADAWKNNQYDVDKMVCFKLKLIMTGKLDNKSVSECCARDDSSQESCVATGDLLCIHSRKLEPTAYCYAKVNGLGPEISNIIERNMGRPTIYKIIIKKEGNQRKYSFQFLKDYLDRNSHASSEMVKTSLVTNGVVSIGDAARLISDTDWSSSNPNAFQSQSDQPFEVTLMLEFDVNLGTFYYATYHIPEYQSLSNITVERMCYSNIQCVNFNWQNVKTPPSYFPAQIETIGYAVITCTGCSNIRINVNFSDSISTHPYSDARTCISHADIFNCKFECSIEVRYFDTSQWLVAIGKSGTIVIEPARNGFKNVHLASANSSCVQVSWQHELDLKVEYFKVTCSNSPLQYNVTNMPVLMCGLSSFISVNCTVSAMFADGESIEEFSNMIVTPCDRPGRVEKIDAAPEFTVDQFGDLIAVIWNITWQPGLPNCQSIGYNVAIEEKGKNYSSETCTSWMTFKSSVVNERFSVAVFATNNEGMSGDNFQESFIYEESQTPTPIVNLTSINSSCALFSIKYPLTEHSVARYIDVDCMLNEHNEAVLNLTLRSLDDVSIPVCLLNTAGTLRCSAVYRNFVGVSSRASSEYNIYAASSTTEHGSSTKPYNNAEADDGISSTEYNEIHDPTEDFTIEFDQTTIENLKNEISANYPSKTTLVKAPTPTRQKVMESTSGGNSVKTDLGSTSQSARTMTMFTAEVYSTAPLAQTTEKTEDSPEKLENISSKMNSTLPIILISICLWLL